MNKQVIILSASTGLGHNQVADTLKKELELQGAMVHIIEPFKETNPYLDEFVTDGYRLLATRIPKMFGTLYKMSNKRLMNRPIAHYTRRLLEEKLEELLETYQPELIICTHALFVKSIVYMKNDGRYTGSVLSVITDYSPHEFYVSQGVNAYIVGSDYTKKGLISRGIQGNRIYVYGIPIKREFLKKQRNSIHSAQFTVLLMGGSMGVSGMKKAYKRLLSIQTPIKIYAVCGNNKSMRASLMKYGHQNHQVEILGFTKQIPKLMDESDVIISKPGGLTVSESLAKNIPMIIPYCIPGQEEENAQMLVDTGAAIQIDGTSKLVEIIEELIRNPLQLEILKRNIERIKQGHSLDETIRLCTRVEEDVRHLSVWGVS